MRCPFCGQEFSNPGDFIDHAKKCRVTASRSPQVRPSVSSRPAPVASTLKQSEPRATPDRSSQRQPLVLNPSRPSPSAEQYNDQIFDDLADIANMLDDHGPPYALDNHASDGRAEHHSPDMVSPRDLDAEPRDPSILGRTTIFRDSPAKLAGLTGDDDEDISPRPEPEEARMAPSGMRAVFIPADTAVADGQGLTAELAEISGPMTFCPFCGARFSDPKMCFCGHCGAKRLKF